MAMIQRREVWERAVALIESGSTTRAAVASKLGVSESAVGYWVTKLRREGGTVRRAELLPVRVTGHVVSGGIEVRVGDVSVSVREGADTAYVAELVRALRSC
jgi:transposase-like protein